MIAPLIDSNAALAGSILAVVLVCTAVLYGRRKGGNWAAAALFAAVASHLIVAYLALIGHMPHAGKDNIDFYNDAVSYLSGTLALPRGPNSLWWSYAASWLFRPLGPSIWLAYAANAWIFFAALVQLLKFATEVGFARHRWWIVLVFAFVPSSLLYANLLFREPFQILCLIYAVRKLEHFRRSGAVTPLVKAIIVLIPFGMIHNGFWAFIPIVLIVAAWARTFIPAWPDRWRFRWSAVAPLALLALAAGVMLIAFPNQRRVEQITSGRIDVGQIMATTEENGARTTFPWRPAPGMVNTLIFSPIQTAQFVFSPIVPFMVEEKQDLVAAIDTLARILMLVGMAVLWAKSEPEDRRKILFAFAVYAAFCFLAAMGSRTVGAALRHHLKIFWLLMVFGLPGLWSLATVGFRRRQVSHT